MTLQTGSDERLVRANRSRWSAVNRRKVEERLDERREINSGRGRSDTGSEKTTVFKKG